jgi:hypothetical protein
LTFTGFIQKLVLLVVLERKNMPIPIRPQESYDRNSRELASLKINVVEVIRSAGIIIFDDSLAAYRMIHPEQAVPVDFFLQEEAYTADVVAFVNKRSVYDFFTEELYTLMCQALEVGKKLEDGLWAVEHVLWLVQIWHVELGAAFGFDKASGPVI